MGRVQEMFKPIILTFDVTCSGKYTKRRKRNRADSSHGINNGKCAAYHVYKHSTFNCLLLSYLPLYPFNLTATFSAQRAKNRLKFSLLGNHNHSASVCAFVLHTY